MNALETYLLTKLRGIIVGQCVLVFFANPTTAAAIIFGKLVGIFYDQFIVPAILLSERKGLLVYDKVRGGIYAKKMEHAQETGNIDDWHDALGGL